MSYFPELLIETYHLLDFVIKRAFARWPTPEGYGEMVELRDKIKKRMKSLGYHDCWGDDDNMEVKLP